MSAKEAVYRNILNENFVISLPDYNLIPSIDKANRTLNNVTLNGTLTGAIQIVDIKITVTV
jgi:propanediol dehydratase small subunit